ncbi:MAG: pyruvate kinase alpha/beta domain-containing protein [Clostridiales bacterium]|nr:hypothetical protein [Eubacteriales bacterium]MDH7567534.1 pyruvate kinase alpha/beta domain-containing protein [Clostridiales bacterium]
MERKVVYFESIKQENTDVTFELVRERLDTLGIKKLVLASTTGATARKAMDYFKGRGIKLIVIPHQFDFHRKENLFPQDLVKALKESGHEVHFGTMLFHTDNLYGTSVPTIMANLLRCFCQGIKVCFEITLMATDAGLLAGGEKVVVMAGTGRGSDTALVMQAASSQNFKRLRVNEIICMPYNEITPDEAEYK